MNKRIAIISVIFIPLFLIALKNTGSKPAQASVEYIPLKTFFGNPEKVSPSISPDGKRIAYLAPLVKNDENQMLNIWVKSVDKNDDKPLTKDADRSVHEFFWSYDNEQILYLKDTDGDENWKLHGINLETKKVTRYTPFDKVQTHIFAYNKHHPTTILLGLNKDNPESHDVYSLDLTTGKLTLVMKNPGKVDMFAIDSNLSVRGYFQEKDDGSKQFVAKNGDSWKVIRTYSEQDNQINTHILGFCDTKNSAYILESKGSDKAQIIALNCATGKVKIIGNDTTYDMAGAYINPDTHEIEAVSCEKEKLEWTVLKKDSTFARVLSAFSGMGNVHITDCDTLQKLWIVTIEKDTSCAVYYVYNAQENTKTELFKARPNLPCHALAPMDPIKITSRDGLALHGYITYPREVGRKNLPMVLYVHGGPWARDSWGYHGLVQWLANRGYVVLQLNFRGSTGYGKKFLNASNKQWAAKMHDDLIDGVEWAIKSGFVDPKKIAIFGGSYGGYAALVGATFTPDTFCCAVDICGPSNLITLLNTFPPYWKLWRAKFDAQIGNVDTEQEFLQSRSPLFKVDAIKIPLLIAQGAQDPRVKQAESEQIVEALKKRNIPYEYILFPDEGHGFVKAENRLKAYAAIDAFLARYLGGRCEA